jgi:hypothetical protein
MALHRHAGAVLAAFAGDWVLVSSGCCLLGAPFGAGRALGRSPSQRAGAVVGLLLDLGRTTFRSPLLIASR